MTLRRVDPEFDAILGTLKSRHRREILYHLEDAETDVVQLDELVDAELARNPDVTDRGAVSAHLHHIQLPKLDEMGWIDYDVRGKTVRYRPETAPTVMISSCRTTESPPDP